MSSHSPSRVIAAFAAFVTGAAFAGPINPPAGPVTSTYKTLSEVEPRIAINLANTPGDADSLFRISQPGSYYLTGNITGVAGKHGIEVGASGVTIDLNGFELAGIATPGFAFDGIRADVAGRLNIAVRGGTVRGWSGTGINLGSFSPSNSIVTDIRATNNGFDGIWVSTSSQVSGCTATLNGGDGIQLGFNSAAFNCVVSLNAQDGINGSVTVVISHCTALQNGIDGIGAGIASKVTDCVAYDNTQDGFSIGSSGSIMGSAAYANGRHGIELFFGASAINCSSHTNTFHGILASDRSQIIGNNCARNGVTGGPGSGIYVSGSNGRIEGNSCIENDRGIEIDGTANLVIRNNCGGNTFANWDIAANNVCGLIVNRSAPASAAILGDAAPSSLGTTDANANFTN